MGRWDTIAAPSVDKMVDIALPNSNGTGRATTADRTERRLIRKLQKGSGAAARSLVEMHWDTAYAAAFLMTRDAQVAEDVAQETVLNAIRNIAEFDPDRPLRPWIHRIAVNRSIDHLRRTDRVIADGDAEVDGAAVEVSVGVTDPEMAAALMSLPVDDRAAVVLRHVFGYRASEIADLMDQPASTTRTQIHRALGRLRAELDSQEVAR